MAYDNSQRAASASTTRARVLDSAKESFLANGYGATTIRRVAEQAGVSQELIYKSFGNKATLLKAVYDVTLAGDDEDVPMAERPIAVAIREAATPAEAVTAYAEMARVISARVDPLLRVLLGSRGTDKGLAEFAATTDRERHIGSTMAVRSWHEQGWIRPDLTIDEAADIVWALNSPGPRWLLEDRGWTDVEVTGWLADMIRRGIFSDQG